jgi:hypothetical protein
MPAKSLPIMVQIEIRKILNAVLILGDHKKGKPFFRALGPLEIDQPEGSEGDVRFRPGPGQGEKQGEES